MNLLKVKHLQKTYQARFSKNKIEALKDIDFSVEAGEFIAIMGESGSGKSTLLNILATLDAPSSGEILLNDENTANINEKDLAKFRREKLGFVFQDFNLLDTFSVQDNIYLPLVLAKNTDQKEEKLAPIARILGIADLLEKYPYELSGGQKQRVAIARALITDPEILLADEPTGALDSRNSDELLELFTEFNKRGQTILMVTHSSLAASFASRVLFIRDGLIFHELYRGDDQKADFLAEITTTMTNLLGRGV